MEKLESGSRNSDFKSARRIHSYDVMSPKRLRLRGGVRHLPPPSSHTGVSLSSPAYSHLRVRGHLHVPPLLPPHPSTPTRVWLSSVHAMAALTGALLLCLSAAASTPVAPSRRFSGCVDSNTSSPLHPVGRVRDDLDPKSCCGICLDEG